MKTAIEITGLDLAQTLKRALTSPALDAEMKRRAEAIRRGKLRENIERIDAISAQTIRLGPLSYQVRIEDDGEGGQ